MIINARKKFYKIHEMQWNGEADEAKLKAFINGTTEYKMSVVSIPGLEGEEIYPKGSVIVQGVHGEFYGMRYKPFDKKYEHVSGNTYQVKDGAPIECLQYTGKNAEIIMKFSPLAVYGDGLLKIQSICGDLEVKPGNYITMGRTSCYCKGSSILSKKAHPFRGGRNCDQTILISIRKNICFI